MNRDVFIGRVGRAAMGASLPAPPAVAERLPDLPRADLVALFRGRAQEADAVVHGPMSKVGVPKAVAGIASGHGCRSFLAWDDLAAPGVHAALLRAGLERQDHTVPESGRKRHQAAYSMVDLGVTGAVAGLAESGSVVLSHGPGRPRMASLIPDVHVALLEASSLERTISYMARKKASLAAESANLVIITGPSRTGDIELHLNLGVHGPRHVHVVMIS